MTLIPPLTFPALAAEALTALDRQSQLHASAFLSTASRHLQTHPAAPLDACLRTQSCLRPAQAPPRRNGTAPSCATPLCLLCAVDVAVERLGYGFPDAIQLQYLRVGTAAKQAAVYTLEANPGQSHAKVCVTVSSRLYAADLRPQTSAEVTAEQEQAACYTWLARANYRRSIPNLPGHIAVALTTRGWMGEDGLVTPQGRFALEHHKRELRRAASLRPVR